MSEKPPRDLADVFSSAPSNRQFEELIEVYRNYLKALTRIQLRGQIAGKTDESDVVQEACLRAAGKLHQFRGSTKEEFLAWIQRILANVIANTVRHYSTGRRDFRLETSLEEKLSQSSSRFRINLAAGEPSPSAKASANEEAVLLANALERLPADYREVIELRQIQQMSFAEVAVEMNRSVPSVRSLWPRALAELKTVLEGEL